MFTLSYITLLIILVFVIGTFSITIYRKYTFVYKIFGKPKTRDLHKVAIPNSCGISFLFIFILSLVSIEPYIDTYSLINIIIGATIVCVNGYWDDLKIINPYQKLIFQLIAVVFIIFSNELVILNLNGFLGIENIPYLPGFCLTTFIGIFMINSFNLIDGIDGLAASSAVISFIAFAILFWVLNYKGYFGMCIIMVGMIISYLPFNYSKTKKTFMGDSGALFIGYILFIMTIIVVNNSEPVIDRLIDRAILPIAPMIIFLLPMVDTFGVYTLRLYKGESPFRADNQHIHHMVLAFTNSHLIASLLINFCCLFILGLFSYLAFWLSTVIYIVLFFVLFFGLVLIFYLFRSIYIKKVFSLK